LSLAKEIFETIEPITPPVVKQKNKSIEEEEGGEQLTLF